MNDECDEWLEGQPEPHHTDATVDWLPTYEYAAKHRGNENPFECPCSMCPKFAGKHRRKE